MTDKELLLKQVQMLEFALDDAALFLDTHPKNEMALAYYKKYMTMRKAAVKKYVAQYGPLTHSDFDGERWKWVEGPWPWQEGEAE